MSVKTHFVFPGQKSIFSLHWSQMVQMGPTGNSIYIYYIILYIIFLYLIQNSYIDLFRPFFTLLGHCGTLTSLSCLVIFGPKWVDPSHGLAFVAYRFSHFIQYQSVIGTEGAKYGIAFESDCALRHWQIMIATLCFSSFNYQFGALAKRTVKSSMKTFFRRIWFNCRFGFFPILPRLQSIGFSPW